jgi:predicted N-acetyltransferase YhbS
MSAADVDIAPFTGSRMKLRSLFELAEDSAAALDASLNDGAVLVAQTGGAVVGHLQLTFLDDPLEAEIKNMAVVEPLQRRGIGQALVAAGVETARIAGATRLVVATATADVGNLRFYQRQGFRLYAVDRDAFTAATGYPGPILIDGIELRDRVWLDRRV